VYINWSVYNSVNDELNLPYSAVQVLLFQCMVTIKGRRSIVAAPWQFNMLLMCESR
jgi:hypothetical protein